MGKIVSVTLPQDLPTNWTDEQFVSPGGIETGLTPQHGYNYLMEQVNITQKAVQQLDEGALASGKRFQMGATQAALLSAVGWYRIAMIEGSTNGNSNALIFLGHNYSNGGPSTLLMSVNFNLYAPSIVVLDYKSTATPFFDKVRIVSDAANKKSYFDVHYNRDLSNSVNAGALFFTYEAVVTSAMQPFTAVADTPANETVTLTQALLVTKNGTVLTSANVAGDIGAAPLGFGLGETAVNTVAANTNANALTRTGFYGCNVNTPDGAWWYGQHIQYSVGYAYQHFAKTNDLMTAERWCFNGLWSAWKARPVGTTVVPATVE